MLSIDLKRSKKIDIIAPIKQIVDVSINIHIDIESFINSFYRVQELRNIIIIQIDKIILNDNINSEILLNTYKTLFRYYQILNIIEKRFSTDPDLIKGFPFQFEWFDSFRPDSKKQFINNSIIFEMVAILFNLGAISSKIAYLQDMNDADGLKNCCKYFQQAAGCFTEALNLRYYSTTEQPVMDISAELLTFLINLMLAQAQICVYELAVLKNSTPGTISKIAAGISVLYQSATKSIQTSTWLVKCNFPWLSHVDSQNHLFYARSKQLSALNYQNDGNYGAEIFQLRSSKKYLLDYSNLMSKKNLDIYNKLFHKLDFVSLNKSVDDQLRTAESDNEKIYHCIIPAVVDNIEAKVLVKAATEFSSMSKEYDVIAGFEALIPSHLNSLNNVSKLRLNEWLDKIKFKIRDATNISNQHLSKLRLPTTLDNIQNPTLSKGLVEKLLKCRDAHGPFLLFESQNKLEKLMQEANQSVGLLRTELKEEDIHDQFQRDTFKDTWTRAPSKMVNTFFSKELNNFESLLLAYSPSHSALVNKIKDHHDGLMMLALSPEELSDKLFTKKLIQRNSIGMSIMQSPPYIKLRELLGNLTTLLYQREDLIRSTTVKVNQHSFLRSLMILKSNLVFESEYKEHFAHIEAELLGNIKSQDPILNELTIYMTEFNKINQNNPLAVERIESVQNIVDNMQLYDNYCMIFACSL